MLSLKSILPEPYRHFNTFTYVLHILFISSSFFGHMIVIYQESEKQKQKEDEEEGEKEIGEYGVNRKIKNVRVTSLERKCVHGYLYLFVFRNHTAPSLGSSTCTSTPSTARFSCGLTQLVWKEPDLS
jgi:hypothetical protein